MAVRFAVIGVMLFAINWFTHPQYLWSLWAIGGMSLALVMRAVRTLLLRNVFSRWQEQRLAQAAALALNPPFDKTKFVIRFYAYQGFC